MTAFVGRDITFTPTGSDSAPVTGMQSKDITINNEPIDITSDDDDGWRRYLDNDPAERAIEMTVEGLTKDAALIELATAGGSALISEYTLTLGPLGSFTGDFHIGTLNLKGEYKDAVKFSCTIRSSGPLQWQATPPS